MMRTGEAFPAKYLVEPTDASDVALVLRVGEGGEVRRAVAVTPFGEAPPWSAALSVPRPLVLSACSGDVPSPRPDAVLLVERGSVFWVEAEHPERYRVIRTDGPVVQVESAISEGLVFLVTPWSITAVAAGGPSWSTPRIAVEGVRLDEVANGWLRGVADPRDEEPRDFAIDLTTGELVGGAGVS